MVLDNHEKEQMNYVLARKGSALLKYPMFLALAEGQEVELGSSYKKTFYYRTALASIFVSPSR